MRLLLLEGADPDVLLSIAVQGDHAGRSQPLVAIITKVTFQNKPFIQGDNSGSSQSPVDMKTKFVFQYKRLILKRNLCFDASGMLGTT